MRPKLNYAIAAIALLMASAGVSVAGAVPEPGDNENSKFVYTETIDPASSNLTVAFGQGGQNRFQAVDYALSARVELIETSNGQTIAELRFPTASITGLVPDGRGRVSGVGVLVVNRGPGCGCGQFRVEYTDVVLTNLTSGHTYQLEAVSRSTP